MNNIKYLFLSISLLFIASASIAQSGLSIAEDFMLKDTEGISHDLFPYLDNDKIVVLSFFTTT